MSSQVTDPGLMLLYCLVIFLGGLLGGVLSVIMRNSIESPKYINLISILGAGLLLGVGLIIIIPEGTSLIYKSYRDESQNAEILCGVSLAGGFIFMMAVDEIFGAFSHSKLKKEEKFKESEFRREFAEPLLPTPNGHIDDIQVPQNLRLKHTREHQENGVEEERNQTTETHTPHTRREEKKIVAVLVTTLGLAIHCFSDGMALGVSQISNKQTGILVFMAVLLHKIPALFGYSVFLFYEEIKSCANCFYVLFISAISPIVALATYAITNSYLQNTSQNYKNRVSGILLVMSAGTFLYAVTLHILPEVYVRKNDAHSNERSKKEAQNHFPKILEMAVLFLGAWLPLSIKFY